MMSEYLTRLLSHVSDKETVLKTEILDKVGHLFHMPTKYKFKDNKQADGCHEMYTTTGLSSQSVWFLLKEMIHLVAYSGI